MKTRFRIGQIVPSSNITMETEVPAMLRARERIAPERFTFHSSRMRMRKVSKEELTAMDREAERCAVELSDARVDVMGYACLVAIMSQGPGYHRQSQALLERRAGEQAPGTTVVSSAGALIKGLEVLGARRVSVITPYVKPLTEMVCSYIEYEGLTVVDRLSLEISDNLAVGERDPRAVLDVLPRLNVEGADAVVLSACVQMPSLEAVAEAEQRLGKPVVTAAVCTVYAMLEALGLERRVPNAGALLSGTY